MTWYYVLDGASRGPVEEMELRNLRAQNVIAADTPVWTDGMAAWQPFELSALVRAGSTVVGPDSHVCAECGRSFPGDEMIQYGEEWVCAACKPLFFQRIKEGVAFVGRLQYASIGRRFGAMLLDAFIFILIIGLFVMVPFMMVATMVVSKGKTVAQEGWVMALMTFLMYGIPPLYEILFLGKYGATPGKMAMKIKVVRPDGTRISYGQSAGRYFAKLLSGIILYIGYLMAFWDPEKRSLHDRLCRTRVIRIAP